MSEIESVNINDEVVCFDSSKNTDLIGKNAIYYFGKIISVEKFNYTVLVSKFVLNGNVISKKDKRFSKYIYPFIPGKIKNEDENIGLILKKKDLDKLILLNKK